MFTKTKERIKSVGSNIVYEGISRYMRDKAPSDSSARSDINVKDDIGAISKSLEAHLVDPELIEAILDGNNDSRCIDFSAISERLGKYFEPDMRDMLLRGRHCVPGKTKTWLELIPKDKFNECGFIKGNARFDIRTIHGIDIKSMMSLYEAVYLYYIAKNEYTGNGFIVDLGPFLGLSTFALLRGVSNNSISPKHKSVFTFDLFMGTGGYEWFSPHTDTNSIFPLFLNAVKNYDEHLSISPGNLFDMSWHLGDIEILFIDASKSWTLNDHIVKTFFTHLKPGSIVVQQDYVFRSSYWIHITMEILKDYFELTECISAASAVFKCVKPLPESLSNFGLLHDYSKEELIAIHKRTIDSATEPMVREVLKIAHAMLLLEFGYIPECGEMLDAIDTDVSPVRAVGYFGVKTNADDAKKRFEAVLKSK